MRLNVCVCVCVWDACEEEGKDEERNTIEKKGTTTTHHILTPAWTHQHCVYLPSPFPRPDQTWKHDRWLDRRWGKKRGFWSRRRGWREWMGERVRFSHENSRRNWVRIAKFFQCFFTSKNFTKIFTKNKGKKLDLDFITCRYFSQTCSNETVSLLPLWLSLERLAAWIVAEMPVLLSLSQIILDLTFYTTLSKRTKINFLPWLPYVLSGFLSICFVFFTLRIWQPRLMAFQAPFLYLGGLEKSLP